MGYPFGSLAFSATARALQERFGSRRQYARREDSGFSGDPIGPDEARLLEESDSLYMASVGEGGWPYVQHRGGPKGFLKVIDGKTIAFADFRGNRQYITTGNLMTDHRVALILVDYPRRTRLKILGHVEILEGEQATEWIQKVRDSAYDAVIERVFVIHVEATDWNCQKHITPRFTEEQIRSALGPLESKLERLESENEALRRKLAERPIAQMSMSENR